MKRNQVIASAHTALGRAFVANSFRSWLQELEDSNRLAISFPASGIIVRSPIIEL